MTDFAQIPRDRTLLSVRLFLVVLVCAFALIFVGVEVYRVANGMRPFFDRFSWGVLLSVVLMSAVMEGLRGRGITRLGREAGAAVIARWDEAPGLRRYLRSTATTRVIAWAWPDVHAIEVGRVVSTSGATAPGLIFTIACSEGEDRIPVKVSPGIYRPLATRSGLERLRAELLALKEVHSPR